MKHIALPAVLAMACVSALLGTISAYAQNQAGRLEMREQYQTVGPTAPLSFSTFFLPETGTTKKIFAVLDPVSPENRYTIYDGLNAQSFSVDVRLTDLESSEGNDIDYRNLSIVTLSQSGASVDTASYNNPPGVGNVITYIPCNTWSSAGGDTLDTMEAKCGSIMDGASSVFYETVTLSSPLAVLVDSGSPTIEVADGSIFNPPPPGLAYKVRIGNDLATYSGIVGNTLTGVSHIDETHLPGELVFQHSLQSGPLDIMRNPSLADTGLYSVGFGLRLIIDSTFKQGDYSGTLTITYNELS